LPATVVLFDMFVSAAPDAPLTFGEAVLLGPEPAETPLVVSFLAPLPDAEPAIDLTAGVMDLPLSSADPW
jgi:hypothetical protein